MRNKLIDDEQTLSRRTNTEVPPSYSEPGSLTILKIGLN